MKYCEFWLEMQGDFEGFRVALVAPHHVEIPDGYELAKKDYDEERHFYVSEWFSGIAGAKASLDRAAQFYSDRKVQFLLFREIRKPIT